MAFAEASLYLHKEGQWLPYNIIVNEPEKESDGVDYFCEVKFGNDLAKKVYGINRLQALVLAVDYLKNQLRKFVDNGGELYLEKSKEQPLDIELALLSDFKKLEAS